MAEQERNQVLKMIEGGKITPEQGLSLMQALDQDAPAGELPPAPAEPAAEEPAAAAPVAQPSLANDPRIERVKSTVRRLWQTRSGSA